MNIKISLVAMMSLLVLFSSSAAATFGLNAFQTEADINSTHGFRLGLINTGEEPLRVSFSAVNLSKGEVSFESEEILLPSSDIKSSPQGSGWYYLNGRYVEINYQEFQYVPRNLQGKDVFSVEVLAKPLNSTGPVYGPDIAHLREIEYNVNFPYASESGGGGVWSNEGYSANENGTGPSEIQEDEDSGRDPGSSSPRGNQSRQDKVEQTETGSINTLTFVLLLTSLITALYIYTEV